MITIRLAVGAVAPTADGDHLGYARQVRTPCWPGAAWNPAEIEAIVCGHGHVDHATGLPSPPSA